MGNRALICTKKDWDAGKGIGVYLHWNGGRDSVEPFLVYCKMRGFPRPDEDNYGWARLCQVISNFFGGDGSSIGIEYYEELQDVNVGDNGTYIIEGWKIVDRAYSYDEQCEHEPLNFLKELDDCQPWNHRLGHKLIEQLYKDGKDVSAVDWNYYYSIRSMADKGLDVGPFEDGKSYPSRIRGEKPITFIGMDKTNNVATVVCDGNTYQVKVYDWRNGVQSFMLKTDGTYGAEYTSAGDY